MNSYIEILKVIRDKPEMYIRQRSIFALHVFLLGWYVRNPKMTSDREIMMAFQDWIQKKYRINSTQSWADIILFYSLNDTDAYENFFKLFDKFVEEYNKKG